MLDASSDHPRAATGAEERAATPPAGHPDGGRPPRRPAAVLVAVLGVLVIASTVGYVLLTGGFGSTAAGADLEGRWSGTGTVAACDGVACPPEREFVLTVDCSWSSCTVPVFDESAELGGAGDRFTASGQIPPWHLRSCPGGGFVTGRWVLELHRDGQAVVGRYTEETTSGCGPVVSRTVSTSVASWDLWLSRT